MLDKDTGTTRQPPATGLTSDIKLQLRSLSGLMIGMSFLTLTGQLVCHLLAGLQLQVGAIFCSALIL